MNTLQKEKRVSNKSKNIEETNKSNDWTADGASASPARIQVDDARRIVPTLNQRLPTLVRQPLCLYNTPIL